MPANGQQHKFGNEAVDLSDATGREDTGAQLVYQRLDRSSDSW